MDYPFDEFGKQMKGSDLNDLPSSFSWETMKPGIYHKVATLKQQEKRRKQLSFWLLFFVFSLGSIGLGLYFRSIPIKQELQQKNTTETDLVANAEFSPNSPTVKNDAASKQSFDRSETDEQLSKPLNSDRTKAGPLSAYKNVSQDKTTSLPAAEPLASNPEQKEVLPEISSKPEKQALAVNKAPRKPERVPNLLNKQAAPTLPSLYPPLLSTKNSPMWALLPLKKIKHREQEKAYFRLGLLAGINWANKPIFPETEQLSADEEMLYAPFTQLHLEKSLGAHLFVQGGIRWQQLNSFLNYRSTTPSTFLAQNVVLSRNIDLITGDTTEVMGDTLLPSTTYRHLGQFNSRTFIQLPLSIGYRTTLGRRWEVGLHAGAVFQLEQKSQGLSLSENGTLQAINTYALNENSNKNTIIHLQAGLRIAYQLSQNLQLGLEGNLQQCSQNWRPSGMPAHRPIIQSYGIGLFWEL